MDTDKISVIIPVFNPGPILSKAIESIVTQDYNDLELVIIDGGSTDGTIDLLKKYNSSIHYWISEPDDGIYDAMNKGVAVASGTWLIFLGADDELCQGVIASIFNSVNFTSTDLIYGKVIIKNERKLLGLQTDFEKLISLNIPHQAIFYHKSIFKKFNGYDLRYKILADYDLNLKIFEDNSLRKRFLDYTVSYFYNSGISNRTIDYNFFVDKKEYFLYKCGLSKRDSKIAKYFFFSGVALILKKDYEKGTANILRSIIFSKNPIHYLLLTIDFILSEIGLRKRYRYV